MFAVSLQVQAAINQPKPSPFDSSLQEEYGVNSIEELRLKYEREAWEKVQASVQESNNNLRQHLLQMQRLSVGASTYETTTQKLNALPFEEETWERELLQRTSSITSSFTEIPSEQPRFLIGWDNFNPFMELSVLSMTSLGFVGGLRY